MRRLSFLCLLAVLVAAQVACNLPFTGRPVDVTPVAPGATPTPGRGQTPSGETPPGQTPPGPTPPGVTPPGETPLPGEITLDMLKNFTYSMEGFDTQAALQDGVYEDGQFYTRLIEPAAFGDLNGDGRPDAVVILATNTGGSGTFFELYALLNQNGTPVQAGLAFIGDRQGINDLYIAGGRIVLDYLTQSATDPFCCPSERRLRSYVQENGALLLASEQVLDGPEAQAAPLPNAILIDLPAEGDMFANPLLVRGRVSQTPSERSLVYFVTDFNGTLLQQGDIQVLGEPGGPGTFAFEFTLDNIPLGVLTVGLADSAEGILRGRTLVVLVVP